MDANFQHLFGSILLQQKVGLCRTFSIEFSKLKLDIDFDSLCSWYELLTVHLCWEMIEKCSHYETNNLQQHYLLTTY